MSLVRVGFRTGLIGAHLSGCALAAMFALAGCETETRVIRDNRPLANLPGAQVRGSVGPRSSSGIADPTFLTPDQLRVVDEDGTITLNARSARHLMTHIAQTMLNNERDLFTEQVLSRMTRAEFEQRGLDPGEAFDLLIRNEQRVMELFDAMPQGERTPGVAWEPLGRAPGRPGRPGGQLVRLRVTGGQTALLSWTAMDMVREDGSWRLRWFGRPKPPPRR